MRAVRTRPAARRWHARPPRRAGDSCWQRLRALLMTQASLTAALRALSTQFRVHVLARQVARTDADACRSLAVPQRARVGQRQVLLCDGMRPLVFAHTVWRRQDEVAWPWLAGLGSRPLGEILFAHPRVRRGPLEYRRLDRRDPLYRAARAATACAAPVLWARRSRFVLAGRALLVSEVFLPALGERR